MLIGLEGLLPVRARPGVGTTLVGRSAPLRSTAAGTLFDASGCRAAILQSGATDISHLAPGVYFIREAEAQAHAQAIREVIITR